MGSADQGRAVGVSVPGAQVGSASNGDHIALSGDVGRGICCSCEGIVFSIAKLSVWELVELIHSLGGLSRSNVIDDVDTIGIGGINLARQAGVEVNGIGGTLEGNAVTVGVTNDFNCHRWMVTRVVRGAT